MIYSLVISHILHDILQYFHSHIPLDVYIYNTYIQYIACQSISLSVQSISLSVYQSISLSVYQSISLSVYQSISLSIQIYVHINL